MRVSNRGSRVALLGAVAVGLYLVVLALTVGLRADHVRPLYDGFSTPPAYRWVDPPSFFASGNEPPEAVSTTIKLGREGSAATGVATPDGQFVINLGRGAIPSRPGARSVAVKISPVAPSTLPPVPGGLRANGNAYRVEMTYEPTGRPVGPLVHPGSLVVEIPELGDNLFGSPAGRRWTKVRSRAVPPRQLSLAAELVAPGYTLAATNLPELVGSSESSSSNDAVAIGVAVAAVATLLLVVGFLLARRRRRHRSASGDEPPAAA